MPDEQSYNWLSKIIENWYWLVGILVAGLIKPIFDFLKGRPKEKAERDISLVEMSETLAHKYMGLFNQATDDLRKLRDELRQRDVHHDNAVRFQRNATRFCGDMLAMIKQAEIKGWEESEARFNEMLKDTVE